jgi:signal transduction histidine kinase
VQFIAENPFASLTASVDVQRVKQVLTNFVTNAVKYTNEGHIRVGYRLTPDPTLNGAGDTSDGLYIYCEDTGLGIPKDKQMAVFERFVKLNDYVQGTGLGLSICKAIVRRMGGYIGVESEGEGSGSTFWIWIPRN